MSALRILVLGRDVATPVGLAHGGALASTAAEATTRLAEERPDVLVVDAACAWALDFVAGIPADARPAVLVVGPTPPPIGLADDWLSGRDPEEARVRLELAKARGRARRRGLRRAFVDPLTSLPNRRAAVRALVREAARARRTPGGAVSLVLVDLDEFKRVNDLEGHVAGDRLLRRVGAHLSRATRSNELVARIGGDEFALVLAGGLAEANRAAERVERALAEIGVAATVVAAECGPNERLLDLYRRTDELLRREKDARHEERSQVRIRSATRSTGSS